MKPIAFNYAEYEKLQAAYEKQKGIIKELLDVFKKLIAVNDTLEADLAAAVEDMKVIAKRSQRSNCDMCNKQGCIGCYVERELEWRGRKEQ